MASHIRNTDIQFLSGGGEMGELTARKDWSKNVLGEPSTWPQSLRTTLSIILHSKFPMFLFWGPELICFYNDAYRPSLGVNGKHPSILGQRGEEGWPEIWPVIKPLIDQVLGGGEATWSEDQLIPIYRNGKLEDVYWTFSYSPVNDESGKVAGVLVTCNETTEKVRVLNESGERENQLKFTLDAAELGTWDLNPLTNKFFGNTRLKDWFGLQSDDEIDLKLATDIIADKDRQNVIDKINAALQPGSDGHYSAEYDIINPKTKQQRTVLAKGRALFENNIPVRFSGILQDITDQVSVRKKIEESDKRFRNTVKQAPLGITILHGPEFVVEMANDTYLLLVDKKENEFVGKKLLDQLPEVKDVVEPLLTNVLNTGIAFFAPELSVILKRYGKEETGYFNLVYHPLKEPGGEVSGIMVVATEVTDSVKAKHALIESETQFRNLVMQSPIPMTIFRGEEYVIELANNIMLENIWRKKKKDVIGKKALEVFPEIADQKYKDLLYQVYHSGKAHTEKESPALVMGDDGMRKFYLDFEYAPLYDTENNVSGIMITANDVTDRVESRMKVEESEKRLSIVINASELGTWEWNLKNDQMSYSDRYLDIMGYDNEKDMLQHSRHLSNIHPDDRGQREVAMKEAMETGSLFYQSRLIQKNGTIKWMEAKGKVFYDENKIPSKMIGTIRDITAEKNRQQELLENEQRFRLLADSMPQHIWTADTEGNLNYYNQSVFDYTGLTLQKIDEDGWLQIVHPDDREENIRQWTKAVTTGEDFLLEHRFRRHDGVYRWQLSRAIPQKDADGKIQMWVGTSTDIEEQKMFTSELERQVQERTKELLHLNESLAQSEQRYHLMVEEVEDYAILYLSPEGIVENWNRGAEKIKGYKAEEIIGKSFSSFYTEEDKQRNLPQTLLNQARSMGKAIQQGWRVRKGGQPFWASVAITAVHDADHNVIGFSKVTHDLTEKKEADDLLKRNADELAKKNKDLEKMNAELQSFAYVSSHDLQEPLRKIQTFASRILSKEMQTLSDSGKDYFRRMQEAAGRMQTLIQDLLAYSRTGTTDRAFEMTDLNRLAEEVKIDIRELHTEKNMVIDIGKLCHLNVIPFQFRQLFYNLIGNAIKFAKPDAAPRILIESEEIKGNIVKNVSLLPDQMYCHISVADNGIGFDPQYSKRIFDVFQRLHGKDEYSGTGIGLAIVKKIVENHNGVITATGAINKGATFHIYIPVQ